MPSQELRQLAQRLKAPEMFALWRIRIMSSSRLSCTLTTHLHG